MSRYKKFLRSYTTIIWLIIFFAFIYSYVSVVKHHKFQTFAWDLAFFDELIWKVSQGIEPRSSFNNLHILGDHFQPIILLFVPLYWIWSDVRLLLVAHAIVASVSVLPIYLLAYKLLKHKLLSLTVSFSFLLFTPYQHAVLDGFHQSVFAPFFIGWMYYFWEVKKSKWFWLMVLGLLLTKEEYALTISAIGLVIMLYYKQIRIGLTITTLGIISLFVIIYSAIPFYQKGPYTHFGYGILGNTPDEVILKMVSNPSQVIQLIITSEKINTVFSSFFSFGFLPLLAPIHLIPVLQQYGVRFIDTVTVHRALDLNHYSFPLAPLFSLATIYGLKKISDLSVSKNILALYLLTFTFFQGVVFHGPLNSLFKRQFYTTDEWERDTRELISQVPPQVVLASQNSLLPHLSQRPKFHLLPVIEDAEYIAVDLHDGPNKYSPLDIKRTTHLVQDLLQKQTFEIFWQQRSSLLLKRK